MQRRMLSALAAAGLGIALALAAAPPSSAAVEPDRCQIYDFVSAEVTPLAGTGTAPAAYQHRLTVRGTKPASNVWMRLLPVKHIAQPDFWGIMVSGCTSGAGLPVVTPYTATYDFNWSMGSCGIEVIGATRSQRFDLAGCRPIPLAGTSWVLDPAGLGVPVPAGAVITANFTGTTVSGSAACNGYRASYSMTPDGAFTLGLISLTPRYCDPVTGAAESAYLARLAASTQVQATGAQLRLRGGGQTLLRFTPAGAVT